MNDWVAQRTEAARLHQEKLQAGKNLEHEMAEAVIAEFMTVAPEHGPAPVPLEVRGYGGKGVARTPLKGWYLRVDGTAAVGEDGKFYVLIAPLTTWERIRGIKPEPRRPTKILGEGGKDGDSIALEDALERAFPGWRSFLKTQ
ncbi:MAG: hypothetical protein LBH13_08265 [Cellulomonadaceae bacterium]|jgi:hypothetical protein|nr:hypothetical protein [Cellulomonadaceae bacterium]